MTALLDAAAREARELDHGWVGVEHLLLALARQDSVAARALEAAGAPYGALRAWLERLEPDPELTPPPRWSETARPTPRLQRLAESAGDGHAEAWLAAVLRAPVSLAASMLGGVAGGPERVAGELRALGHDPGELPAEPEWLGLPHGEPVYVPGERLEEVVRVAAREIGVGFAFNRTKDGRGRLSAPVDVDLRGLVDRVLGDG